jgi:hypothetical protein
MVCTTTVTFLSFALAVVSATQADFAGTCGSSTAGTANGAAAAASFKTPRSIAVSGFSSPMIYISDTGSHTIRKISGTTVSTIAGQAGTSGSTDGTGAAARFKDPTDLVVRGNVLYIADQGNSIIRQMDLTTNVVSTLAGTANDRGYVDGTGAAARFGNPVGLALSPDGTELFVVDYDEVVRKIVLSSAVVSTLAGVGGANGYVDNNDGTLARFHSPFDAVHAHSGTAMYVSDGDNHVIRQINTATGAVTTIAGSNGASGTTDAANGASARFNHPRGLALSHDDATLYVADKSNNLVRAVDLNNNFAVSTVATTSLNEPIGLALQDVDGKLLIVDKENNCIRSIVTSSVKPPSTTPAPPSATPAPLSAPATQNRVASFSFILAAFASLLSLMTAATSLS